MRGLAVDGSFAFTTANPYGGQEETVLLPLNDTMEDIAQKLSIRYFRPLSEETPRRVQLIMPFGPPSEVASSSAGGGVPVERAVGAYPVQPFTGFGLKLADEPEPEGEDDEDFPEKTYPEFAWCVVSFFDSRGNRRKQFVQEIDDLLNVKNVKDTILARLNLMPPDAKLFAFRAPRCDDYMDRGNRKWKNHFLSAGEDVEVRCVSDNPVGHETLSAIPEGNHPVRPFPVKVMYHTEPLTLEDTTTDTSVCTIFEKVATKLKLEMDTFVLVFDRRYYKDERTTYILENKGTIRDHFPSCVFQKMFLNVRMKMPEEKTIELCVKKDKEGDGMTFTVNPQETDFTDVANMVSEKLGITPVDFLEKYRFYDVGTKLVHHYRRVAEFITPTTTTLTVYLRPRLAGGGIGNKVMKHVLKKNVPPIKAGDEQDFGATFQVGLTIANATTYDLKFGINELALPELNELQEILSKNNRAPNASKIERVIASMKAYKQMEFALQKLMQSMETFKSLAEGDVEQNFMNKDGGYNMEKLREVVAVAIAMKSNASVSG